MSLVQSPDARPPVVSPNWALFLDLDGTLVEVAETPDGVRIPAGLADLLARLRAALGGALGLVSGRPISLLDRLFHPMTLPAVGLHGAEWRAGPDGPVRRAAPASPAGLAAMRPLLERFAAQHPGVLVEDKGGSFAIHYRQRPAAADAAAEAASAVVRALGDEYHVLRGKMMVEIKLSHVNKGSALRDVMQEPPFAGRVPAFVGDDVTDEDGFAAVNEMGGYAVKVGLDRPTAARYRLPDVPAVHRWLAESAERMKPGGHGRS
jgi:trehalose 6-phosphate phosphatase